MFPPPMTNTDLDAELVNVFDFSCDPENDLGVDTERLGAH